ncbi:MAG: TonB-dependent receptor [Bacteroidetes bacterium]|jgi:outer membrane receptor protein involved in Fe transport|nr:TonB-dependent receptor [Bacteroidota bacterium]
MKKIVFLFVLIIGIVPCVHSQSIQGYVFFNEEQSPVEYGSVVLKTLPDSAFVSGVITYSKGQYTFNNVEPGKYRISSSYLGYQESAVNIEVTNGSGVNMADTIYLFSKSVDIEEATVEADYIRGKELVDRTVYSIPPEISETSVNGYEILRKLPSVQVDFNNNITLNGSSNFIIQVDGKERNKEFLARLTPADIKSIEIIHNPSGKYDGSIDGVINVILNPEARMGFSGNIVGVVKPFNRTFAFGNAGLDYGREKITYYISGYSFRQSLAQNTDNEYRFKGNSSLDSVINLEGNGDFLIAASAINTGFDYYINDKHNLSINYSYKPNKINTELENNGSIYVQDELAHQQDYSNTNQTKSGESNVSIYFQKEFNKPIQEFTMESNVYWFNSDDENTFASRLYPVGNPMNADSSSYVEIIENNRNYVSSKFDYVHPLGVSMRLETGYQFYYQNMAFNTENTDVLLSNKFNYNEWRNAIYLSWMWNIDKFGFMATIREEHSDIRINDSTSTSYFTFLPSTNIQYKINSNQNVKLTYNRRIDRPGIYQLNPFERLNNYQFISSGNPYLEPEHRDHFELKYSLNFKKNFISPFVYHTIISEKIGTLNRLVTLPNSDNLFIRTSPDNVLTGYEQGLGLNSMLGFVKLDGKVFQGHFNKYSDGNTTIDSHDYFSYNLSGFVFYQPIKEILTIYSFGMYQGVRFDAQSKTISHPVYGAGGNYKLDNHTFAINWVFPGIKDYTYDKVITETPALYSKTSNNFDVRYFVQFVYSFNFKKGKSIKKIGHKSDIESDTKGGGIQN